MAGPKLEGKAQGSTLHSGITGEGKTGRVNVGKSSYASSSVCRGGAGPDSGPLAGHPLENVLLAGPHRGFTRSVRQMVLVRGAATAAGAGGAWAVGRLTGLNGRASTMGLAALVTTQLGQTAWAGRRSPVVLLTAASSLAALVALVQTPGLNRYFGCTMLDPLSWLVVLGWAAAATVGAEAAPQALARHRSRRTPPGEQPVPQTS
jgi:cation-transporting ATPase I